MALLTIPRDRIREAVKPGDVIVEVDGRPRPENACDLVVHDRPWDMAGAVRLVNYLGGETEWHLYPDTQVEENITVERYTEDEALRDDLEEAEADEALDAMLVEAAEQQAADGTGRRLTDREVRQAIDDALRVPEKPHKPAVRVVEGVRLLSEGPGGWRSEDGRYEVSRDNSCEYLCEAEHPVRLTHALAQEIKARPHLYPSAASWAVTTNARGYLCPGGETHHESLWIAWDTVRNDHVGGSGPGSYTTMGEALDNMALSLRNGWGQP